LQRHVMACTKPVGRIEREIVAELHKVAELLGADPDNIRNVPAAEMYDALEALGADRFLLGIVGSWKDTMEDVEVLELLREWNRLGSLEFDEVDATPSRPARPARRQQARGPHGSRHR
jgi:hypothetical protein